jgi:hypothetical protein
MSITVLARTTALCVFGVFVLLSSHVLKAEYAEGTLSYDWNPETKKYKKVYKDWQEGIVYDKKTGDYFVVYKDYLDTWNEVRFEPATKIDPTLKSKFKLSDSANAVVYEYKLSNGPKAKQNIEMFLTHVSNINPGGPVAPTNWDGRAFPTFTDSNLLLSWTHEGVGPAGGLAPGKTADGFKIESNDLPGVVVMKVKGNARHTTWLAHQPNIDTPVGQHVALLETMDHVPEFAAAPVIPVPTPFDAGVVLTAIQKHLANELVRRKLVEPSLAGQLDQLLQAAIVAANGGNTVALKSHLKALRQLLRNQYGEIDKDDDKDDGKDNGKHENTKSRPIDKLAARVLDFDLKYIQRRLGND